MSRDTRRDRDRGGGREGRREGGRDGVEGGGEGGIGSARERRAGGRRESDKFKVKAKARKLKADTKVIAKTAITSTAWYY